MNGFKQIDTMNHPRRVQFTNGNVTKYVYTSTGEKLRTMHRTAAVNTLSVDSTDYIGNFIFRNGKADKYLFGGGYCTFTTASQPVYHYYTRDHLGNNRAVVNENGTLEQVTHYYPFGGVYGDAGLNASLQPYKYNGKELDRVHGLDLYDYGARNYDAIIGRWTTMDPVAERTPEVSPYVYCVDNPVNAIDPDGRKVVADSASETNR
ncbi:MAG: RHS repeat-associated core domain-containing protein [Prevotella sp.]|jgi:RHS repeat-associated protein|nr:RHS repeat-associated core domain-containing protein [Prevotella sp.]MCH3994103.1 RHS repeat-associated core domain-containing protein [Prevotella sp.]